MLVWVICGVCNFLLLIIYTVITDDKVKVKDVGAAVIYGVLGICGSAVLIIIGLFKAIFFVLDDPHFSNIVLWKKAGKQ